MSKTTTETVILYHDSCMDGSAAAIIAYTAHPEARLIPVQYGDPLPEPLAGKHIIMVDFSYKREVMECLQEQAVSFICLDHHKTAEEELRGVPDCEFDMNRSGARMAWDKWNDREPPWWVLYIEDRDLWRFDLVGSRDVNASLRSYGMSPRSLTQTIADEIPIERHATMGEAIMRYQRQVIDQHARHAEDAELFGHTVPVVNATVLFSEIVGSLAKDREFAASYFVKANGDRVYQLRSDENGLDVSELARSVGGGGHKHAAGFTKKAT